MQDKGCHIANKRFGLPSYRQEIEKLELLGIFIIMCQEFSLHVYHPQQIQYDWMDFRSEGEIYDS